MYSITIHVNRQLNFLTFYSFLNILLHSILYVHFCTRTSRILKEVKIDIDLNRCFIFIPCHIFTQGESWRIWWRWKRTRYFICTVYCLHLVHWCPCYIIYCTELQMNKIAMYMLYVYKHVVPNFKIPKSRILFKNLVVSAIANCMAVSPTQYYLAGSKTSDVTCHLIYMYIALQKVFAEQKLSVKHLSEIASWATFIDLLSGE